MQIRDAPSHQRFLAAILNVNMRFFFLIKSWIMKPCKNKYTPIEFLYKKVSVRINQIHFLCADIYSFQRHRSTPVFFQRNVHAECLFGPNNLVSPIYILFLGQKGFNHESWNEQYWPLLLWHSSKFWLLPIGSGSRVICTGPAFRGNIDKRKMTLW